MAGTPGIIGKGIRIKGELSGTGDLVIEGTVEGRVQLDNHLIIESSGAVSAQIDVERLTVLGRAAGDIEARTKVELKASARVEGDIRAPSVVLEDGAAFRGTIHMEVGIPEELL